MHCSALEDISVSRPDFSTISIAPNPVRGSAEIRYNRDSGSRTKVSVYDVHGQLVWKSEVPGGAPGVHRITWDCRDAFGNAVASGIYFARVETRAQEASAKIVVIK